MSNDVLFMGLIVWLHFIADFVLQTDDMAMNKSTDNWWLLAHSVAYSIPMLLFCGWQFALINGVAHFCVDYCTSRGTKRLWAANETHWFFTLIGFDQAIHLSTLIFTYTLLR